MRWPDLSEFLGAAVRWAVVGAVATRMYMPERVTHDLDIAIAAGEGTDARNKLAAAGFRCEGELAIGGSTWVSPAGWRVDVLEASDPWIGEALAAAQNNRDPQGLPVLPLKYLVLMKFQSGRVQDLADVTRMLGLAGETDLNGIRALFARFSPDEVEDLESLIRLGKLEYS